MSAPRPSRLSLWGPPAVLAGAIFVLSSFSTLPAPEAVSDKVAHLVVFGLLASLTLRATHGSRPGPRLGPTLAAMALAVGWGALDEVHQMFVPGRFASAADLVADGAGALVGLAAYALRSRLARRERLVAAATIPPPTGGGAGEGA